MELAIFVPLVIGVLTFAAGIYATMSARKASNESTTIVGFKALVESLQKEVEDHSDETASLTKRIRGLSQRVDRLERRELEFIRWSRQVLAWYDQVYPLLQNKTIPPFPKPPPGIEDTDPRTYVTTPKP